MPARYTGAPMDEPSANRGASSPASSSGRDWRALRALIATQPSGGLSESDEAALALRESFELYERGIRMMRMNLRREDPAVTEEELTLRLRRWLGERSGAPFGDGVGHPAPERLARILGGAD